MPSTSGSRRGCRFSGVPTASSVGQEKFSADHAPVFVFPNPLNPRSYVVINSGFTFHDQANNAMQSPKLPDWAVVDITKPGNNYPLPAAVRRPRKASSTNRGSCTGPLARPTASDQSLAIRSAPACGIAALSSTAAAAPASQLQHYEGVRMSMACAYAIEAYAAPGVDLRVVVEEAFDEVDRIDRLMSHYKAESPLSRLNREAARHAVAVDKELFDFIERSLRYSDESGGAFDITVGPLMKAWGFFRGDVSRARRQGTGRRPATCRCASRHPRSRRADDRLRYRVVSSSILGASPKATRSIE